MQYKITDTISPSVITRVDPHYKIYQLLMQNKKGGWISIKPTHEDLKDKKWYKQFTFYDPNELNEKCGLPPFYIVLKKGSLLEDWVKQNFEDVKISETSYDFCFEGTYKGAKKNE